MQRAERGHGAIDGAIDRNCGPEGYTIDWLASERVELDDDPVAFQKLATDARGGGGLPLVPPRAAATGRAGEDGQVHLLERPEHLLVMVNGGFGGLHVLAPHSFGPTRTVTRAI